MIDNLDSFPPIKIISLPSRLGYSDFPRFWRHTCSTPTQLCLGAAQASEVNAFMLLKVFIYSFWGFSILRYATGPSLWQHLYKILHLWSTNAHNRSSVLEDSFSEKTIFFLIATSGYLMWWISFENKMQTIYLLSNHSSAFWCIAIPLTVAQPHTFTLDEKISEQALFWNRAIDCLELCWELQ